MGPIRASLLRARELLGPSGLTVEAGAALLAEILKQAGSPSRVIEAVQYFCRLNPTDRVSRTGMQCKNF